MSKYAGECPSCGVKLIAELTGPEPHPDTLDIRCPDPFCDVIPMLKEKD